MKKNFNIEDLKIGDILECIPNNSLNTGGIYRIISTKGCIECEPIIETGKQWPRQWVRTLIIYDTRYWKSIIRL